MFVVSAVVTYVRALTSALLAAFSARPAAELLATPNVHLYSNTFTPSPDSVLADFTECTFTGYAAVPLGTLSAPVNTGASTMGVVASVLFTAGSPFTTPDNAVGYFITDTTNAILYCAERFSAPIPFAAAGDFLDLTVVLPLPLSQARG